MSEKYISTDNKGKLFSALLADLPKAFQCFSHTFLIVKPHAYGFSIATLRLIYSYLSNRKQRTNVNFMYSFGGNLFGVPEASILGL